MLVAIILKIPAHSAPIAHFTEDPSSFSMSYKYVKSCSRLH